MKTYENGAF